MSVLLGTVRSRGRVEAARGPPSGDRARRWRSRTASCCGRRRSSGRSRRSPRGTAAPAGARAGARRGPAARGRGRRRRGGRSRPRAAPARTARRRGRRSSPVTGRRQRLHGACHGACTSPRTTMPSAMCSSVPLDVDRLVGRDRRRAAVLERRQTARRTVEVTRRAPGWPEQVGDRDAERIWRWMATDMDDSQVRRRGDGTRVRGLST